MYYRKRETGEVLNYQELLLDSPNVYIPSLPTAAYLNDVGEGYDIVIETLKPEVEHADHVLDGVEEIDGEWHQKWKSTPWTAEQIAAYEAGKAEDVQEHIEAAQVLMWERIKAKRTEIRFGGVEADGMWFDSDVDGRVQWLNLERKAQNRLVASGKLQDQLYIDGSLLEWKTMTNEWVPVTVQLALQVIDAMEVLESRAHKVAEIHKAEMIASPDPLAYDYSTGWPATFKQS